MLDRGVRFDRTSLEEAAKYALLSLDSTMKSNVTVGPPIDLIAYSNDELDLTRQRRFEGDDPAWNRLRARWDVAMRQAIARLPAIRFAPRSSSMSAPQQQETIQVVEPTPSESINELQPQASDPPPQQSPRQPDGER
jgi:predicted proteasome-type protease